MSPVPPTIFSSSCKADNYFDTSVTELTIVLATPLSDPRCSASSIIVPTPMILDGGIEYSLQPLGYCVIKQLFARTGALRQLRTAATRGEAVLSHSKQIAETLSIGSPFTKNTETTHLSILVSRGRRSLKESMACSSVTLVWSK